MTATNLPAEPGRHELPGAYPAGEGCTFTVEAKTDASVSLLLYKKERPEPACVIPMDGGARVGRSYSVRIPKLDSVYTAYNFLIDGKVCQDPCARVIIGQGRFGVPVSPDTPHHVRCGFLSREPFDWENTDLKKPAYRDMILYKLHVRGYTKQRTQVPAGKRGTFAGLQHMIPYWQELGINAVELMPAYDFHENAAEDTRESEEMVTLKPCVKRTNFWGYTDAFYFAPKSAYCAGKDAEREMKELVKAMHRAGIACIMEFYFGTTVTPYTVLNILRFWRLEYHIDGFHLMGDGVPLELVLRDALLADTLIMAANGAPENVLDGKNPPSYTYAECHSGFLEDMRRFLKSDEGMVEQAKYRIGRSCDRHGVVNYMVFQDGFTLQDMVSYNYRHNEANGEDNTDGSSFNYSWNCGVEGPSRKTAVKNMRRVQMRNAFAMMLLSQGVPMLYAGDEVGNSQKGNNNAWCQDNPIGWVDWKGETRNGDLTSFVKKLIAFRQEHPVLRSGSEASSSRMYKGRGFPVVSYHGERAWFCSSENSSRLLGVMYAGPCALKEDGSEDDYLYVAYNFHWESRDLALPALGEGHVWKKLIDTGDLDTDGFVWDEDVTYEKTLEVAPRTITVLVGVKEPEAVEK